MSCSITDLTVNKKNKMTCLYINGISYMMNISNIDTSDIGSQLCFCIHDLIDCSFNPSTIRVAKGQRFSENLVFSSQLVTLVQWFTSYGIWLPDATLDYFSRKQIVLFILAMHSHSPS